MEIGKFKILYLWNSIVKDNKCKEFQISWYLYLMPKITFDLDLIRNWGHIFTLDINLFNIIALNIKKNKETDHAGLRINFILLGLDFDYNHYDIRHWDDENDKWCIYE